MSAPAPIPTPGDIARRTAPAPHPDQDQVPEHDTAAPGASGGYTTPPRPMYVPRTLTLEESIAPGVLADTEYFRSIFRWCLLNSSLPPHARLLAHDLLHRANHKSGRIGAQAQPDTAQLALATGLGELQVTVALNTLQSRGWIAYRPPTFAADGRALRPLYDLVIPALALERARGRRYLLQQQ
ncbi:hypothetical protein RM863_29215 [Streptomyces sp. DSM 41014]|uniref:MarR family transcriptional regulator n=1 Tax=Streptomyces hintoniae TaxID=3075521 RepID=A0ABU2USG1_9ACTN|nr:hypothetical protein [Streptomyces sp. DSM 41014]MDT0476212.1 hypothetical protein [Streptomyces sp. DSM 41014]